MRSRRIHRIVGTVVAVLATVFVTACVPAPPPASPAALDNSVRQNDVRELNGIPGIWVDGSLQQNAQMHAERLAAGAPNCSRLWHSDEMAAWYGGHTWGENVGCVPGCPNDAGQIVNIWLASPGHAANVFNPAFGRIGVGVACSGSVQMVVAHYRSP